MSLHHGLRSAAGASTADPYFANTSLLLLGNGTNGGQNNTFTDSSSNAFSITRYGNTTQGSFSPFGYNWSNYFDGSGDYLSAPANSAFAFGTGALTVEAWIYLTAYPSGYFCVATNRPYNSGNNNTWLMLVLSDGTLRFGDSLGGVSLDSTTKLQLNRWYHIAACRVSTSSNQTFVFINGTVEATGTVTYDFSTTTNTLVCGWSNDSTAGNYLAGYLSNLRILKGSAQYNAAFTPPTAPLSAITNTSLLTCQSNRFIDNSSNAFAITFYGDAKVTNFAPFATGSEYSTGVNGGSGYFDGSGDYLEPSSGTNATNFGTGDFTAEFWYYPTADGQQNVLDNFGNAQVAIYRDSNKYMNYYVGANRITSTTKVENNTWTHVALVRNSGTTKLYINGTKEGSDYSDSTNFGGSSTYPKIGISFVPNVPVQGYVSSLRITKSAVYSGSSFTIPTAPLTAITNTSLLLNFTNASILDSTGKNNLETVGDAQISTSTKKFGTGSLKFDGTGDSLLIANNSALKLGSGDFTIEAWIYLAGYSPGYSGYYITIIVQKDQDDNNREFALYLNGTSSSWTSLNLTLFSTNTSYTTTTANNTFSLNTWYHVAAVRNGATVRFYVNGTDVGGGTNGTNIQSTNAIVNIGSQSAYFANLGYGYYLNGYIDDLRITKGVARYTAAFTPPSRQLPAR